MTPEYDQFIKTIQQHAGVSWEEAERAARAALQTLGERIAAGEARDLAERLPPEAAPWLFSEGDAQAISVDEFLRRIADREDTDVGTAERHARAVFAALGRAVGRDEVEDMAAELPREYRPLVADARGEFAEVLPTETFLRRVAERAGVDEDNARRATAAVLQTLAERIAGGEVEDLISRLPAELHEPLRRGTERSGGKATRMSLDDFVRRVADEEGVRLDQATEHARAVLTTLHEAIPEDEWLDVTAQLPADYVAIGAEA